MDNETFTEQCNHYKTANLKQTILEANQTANLEDKYVLGEQLGLGQFGVIKSCTDKVTGELLACKSISKERLVTVADARSVKLEIDIMTRLSGHPNVVELKAVYEDQGYVHLVMELCAGGELFHCLEKYGRFSEAKARILFRHLMQVVSYCHEVGVVHRDLKPENILFATTSSSSPIKLADFGLATYLKPGENLHGTVGSPFYIAPEVLAGGYNQAADVWSAGVILYILLSGLPPFWGETKSRIFDSVRAADLHFPPGSWDRISESAKNLIRGMLCTNASQRLTAKQVLDHLWTKDDGLMSETQAGHENQSCGNWELGAVSFATSCISRNLDISFGTSPTISCDSPSLLVPSETLFAVPSTSCFASAAFSFHDTLDISPPPLSSSLSFAFFSSSPIIEHGNHDNVVGEIPGESTLVVLLDSSPDSTTSKLEHNRGEVKRAVGTRTLGICSKRNRTIGLGEQEQLDFVVSESVIRWASCTNLPTATSLRSSLVC